MASYFNNLFKALDTNWNPVVNCISTAINEYHSLQILKPVDTVEVKRALFHMHPDKSPGLDGMSPGFYQKYWPTVSGDVTKMVQNFFQNGVFEDNVTDTNIVLVPKKQSPRTMADLRPIPLCNVVYKVTSKVIANRLKEVIDLIISENQSAFIPGRLKSDNIMIAYEVMHYMKRKNSGKQAWMALKLDMSKAYDRVEWGYLRDVLSKMGFNDRVVNLFMQCVTSARYKINHSGREFGNIIPGRGLRQGDPLSSYLFLICTEGFSALLKKYESQGLLGGVRVARGAPRIFHMLFADDSYIFCKADTVEARRVCELLSTFEGASGQKINVQKSSAFFSKNVSIDSRRDICEVLNFQEADDNSQYLGLPNFIGRKKSAMLGYLKERVRDGVQAWDGKFLSKGGKEILIKTMNQAILNYAMSVFLLLLEMCREMEMSMCKFW